MAVAARALTLYLLTSLVQVHALAKHGSAPLHLHKRRALRQCGC